jgi:hypothetical protein
MTISSYFDLAASVQKWTHRDDLSDVIPDFIYLVENRLNRELRLSQQETKASLSIVSGYADLPTGFLAVRTVVLETSPVQELTYIPPNEMDRIANNDTAMLYYTITENKIRFNGSSSDSVSMVYYAQITPLGSNNITNWLITDHPDIYLYGCLAEAFSYTQSDDQAHKYMQLFVESLNTLKRADVARKSGQSMRVRVA